MAMTDRQGRRGAPPRDTINPGRGQGGGEGTAVAAALICRLIYFAIWRRGVGRLATPPRHSPSPLPRATHGFSSHDPTRKSMRAPFFPPGHALVHAFPPSSRLFSFLAFFFFFFFLQRFFLRLFLCFFSVFSPFFLCFCLFFPRFFVAGAAAPSGVRDLFVRTLSSLAYVSHIPRFFPGSFRGLEGGRGARRSRGRDVRASDEQFYLLPRRKKSCSARAQS
jgi:hypothetical protein